MRRLLVTGGAGFIGRNLIAHLRRSGDPLAITVLDDESLGDRRALDGLDAAFVAGDVRDPRALERVVPGHDAVVHLAAHTRVDGSIADPAHDFEVNALGSFRLLQACRRHGVRRVIAASTGGAILGEAPVPVQEAMPACPLAPYGASKLAMEGYLSAFGGAYGLSTLALRFSNVYGPGSGHKDSVVARFCRQLLAGAELTINGDGSQVRDFLYVADLAEGIRQALLREPTGVLQLGSGRPTRLTELLALLVEAAGVAPPQVRHAAPRPGEVRATWCDVARARAALDFQPATSLRDGLAATWAWFADAHRATGAARSAG